MSTKKLRILSLAMVTFSLAGCDDADDEAPPQRDASVMDAGDDASTLDGSADAGDAELEMDAAEEPVPDATIALPDATIRIDAGAPSTDCDRYAEPFDRAGDHGLLVGRFLAITPELDIRGRYDWTVELMTSTGEPVAEATLEAKGFMPAHGHGTSPITVRYETGSARYELHDVNLFMAGKWEVRLTVQSEAGDDRIVFRACVTDPPDAGADAGESDEDGGDSEG